MPTDGNGERAGCSHACCAAAYRVVWHSKHSFYCIECHPLVASSPCRCDAGSHAAAGGRGCFRLHLVTTPRCVAYRLSLEMPHLQPASHLN